MEACLIWSGPEGSSQQAGNFKTEYSGNYIGNGMMVGVYPPSCHFPFLLKMLYTIDV